jgi:protein-tyrosine phosphatase
MRRFIDLTEPGEHDSYEPVLADLAAELGIGVTHRRLAIRDVSVPAPSRMREILDELEEDLERPEGVYVHCRGGAGRTGMVVGCYLIERGLDPPEALAAIAADRVGTSRAGWSSPETPEQQRFVLEWRAGRA